MKFHRALMIAITPMVATTAALVPGAADAAVGIEAGAGAVTATGMANGHVYEVTMTTEVAPDGPGSVLVTWECQADGTPDAISTTISECSINGLDALPVTLPGPLAATADTGVFPVGVKLVGCVAGSSSFPETQLGTQGAGVPETCGTVDTVSA